MSEHGKELRGVPTNIITGFLGVGKTSAILHLLKAKPEGESWAVLVNEFGEVGVDGSLFSGQHSEQQGVFIREVPGGCMCCAAGLPMQIALNQLLVRARPDRLLIEPTGLGHPQEVLEVLTSDVYKQILSLQKTLVLVDARKLQDERYTRHQTFNQQIAIADIVVGNKQDLYSAQGKEALQNYVQTLGHKGAEVSFTEYGQIDPAILSGSSKFVSGEGVSKVEDKHHDHDHDHDQEHEHEHKTEKPLVLEQEIPAEGYLKAVNQGEGYQSTGWRFSPEKVFSRSKLRTLLSGLSVDRMKAVFITDEGIFGYNFSGDTLGEFELDDANESRIELIYRSLDESIEANLMQAMLN